ncbi:ABC transporter substrate-binding protein, partial [Paenibacillus sp. MCAF20]
LMMTSGQLPDLISMGSWESAVKKLWEGDHVYALNELAEQYDPYFFKVAGDGTLKWYRQPNGNTYGVPNDSYSPNLMHETGMTAANQTFLVRKDLYEEMGKPDLSTSDGFLNALQLIK